MARPSKHDGAVFKRNDGKIRFGLPTEIGKVSDIRESTFTEDWQEAQAQTPRAASSQR